MSNQPAIPAARVIPPVRVIPAARVIPAKAGIQRGDANGRDHKVNQSGCAE